MLVSEEEVLSAHRAICVPTFLMNRLNARPVRRSIKIDAGSLRGLPPFFLWTIFAKY